MKPHACHLSLLTFDRPRDDSGLPRSSADMRYQSDFPTERSVPPLLGDGSTASDPLAADGVQAKKVQNLDKRDKRHVNASFPVCSQLITYSLM